MGKETTKLYCYVDESGQDARSDFFIVVSIVNPHDQQKLRGELLKLEKESRIDQKKWRKSRSPDRENFLIHILDRGIAAGKVYYRHHNKPVSFSSALLETLAASILLAAPQNYRCIIYVDGINEIASQELTNALRLKGIKTALVRTARDESEPMIRLADRWVGCIRASLEGTLKNKKLVETAIRKNYLEPI